MSKRYNTRQTTFGGYLNSLREIVRTIPIEQKRDSGAPTETAVKEKNKEMEYKLYGQFAKLFPQIISGEYRYMRLESNEYEPPSVEWTGSERISVMHTYTMNNDLMYDAMIDFTVDWEAWTITATAFEQSMSPLYQRVEKNGNGVTVMNLLKGELKK